MTQVDPQADLAADVLRRLESDEPLSRILPAARRLMTLLNRPTDAQWLLIEEIGINSGKSHPTEPVAVREAAFQIFERTRGAADPNAAVAHLKSGKLTMSPDRSDLLISASIAELERANEPPSLKGPIYDQTVADDWLRGQIMYREGRRVVDRVRTELHDRVATLDSALRDQRQRLDMFGRDHGVVFQACGALLTELANCPLTLERTGPYLAAQEARTALMKLGRELYKGPQTHVSPIDGKTYEAKRSEMHSLAALIGDLYRSATDPGRQEMLRNALADADRAYVIGSRAKTPTAITYDEAVDAIKCTYRVARALVFNGALPVPRS